MADLYNQDELYVPDGPTHGAREALRFFTDALETFANEPENREAGVDMVQFARWYEEEVDQSSYGEQPW